MTRDVCLCGHLEQTHDDGGSVGKKLGACHAPACTCEAFRSEDDEQELAA